MSIKILKVDSSIFNEKGVSTQLTSKLIDEFAKHQDIDVTHRNLSSGTIPHFNAETIEAIGDGKAGLADTLISEVQDADVIVLGVPMYNFGIPSELKAWFDHIARAGITFKYTENGPVGLLGNKKVYVLTTRGGIHKDKPSDIEVPFLKTMLGFLGLTDLTFIYAEGLNMGNGVREKNIALAESGIRKIINELEIVT